MDVIFTSRAREDLESLSREQLKSLKNAITSLEEKPTDREDTRLIRVAGREYTG